jgi:hypothetical protein
MLFPGAPTHNPTHKMPRLTRLPRIWAFPVESDNVTVAKSPELRCSALTIIRFDYLSVEHGRGLGKC